MRLSNAIEVVQCTQHVGIGDEYREVWNQFVGLYFLQGRSCRWFVSLQTTALNEMGICGNFSLSIFDNYGH